MKSILFIYGDNSIQKEASDILLEEGYSSLFADNYRDGIRLITENRSSVVMVILDINLLVDSGIDIYDMIKEIDPNLPVVTTSTAGHYRPKLGTDRKLVRYGKDIVGYDE